MLQKGFFKSEFEFPVHFGSNLKEINLLQLYLIYLPFGG